MGLKNKAIAKFLADNTSVYIDESYADEVTTLAREIMATGVKAADAHHAASAIIAKCDYILTTDDRLLKYKSDKIKITDPIDFIRQTGG